MMILAFGGALLFSTCTVETPKSENWTRGEQGEHSEEENLASTEQTTVTTEWGWTPWVSEEYEPHYNWFSCPSPSLVNGFQCSGSYCDNIRAYCQITGANPGIDSYWTSPFSEEGTNYRICDPGYWVEGFKCTGSYCDNISLLCGYLGLATPANCYWTDWISEENGGTLFFGYGYGARGAQCRSSYCDEKRFYVCQNSTGFWCNTVTCGENVGPCWCDDACVWYGDCCANACTVCGQCG